MMDNSAPKSVQLFQECYRLYQQHQLEQALQVWQQAVQCQENKDLKSEAMMLYNVGVTLNGLEKFDQSIACMSQALSVFKEIEDRNGEALTLHYMGVLYSWKSEPQAELDYYLQAVNSFHALGDRRQEAHVRASIAMSYQGLNNLFTFSS